MDELVTIMISFAELTDAVRRDPAVRDSEYARQVLTAACHFYQHASPEQRHRLRTLLPSEIHEQLIWHFVPTLVASFSQTGDVTILRAALVALSLDNKGWDYRDTFLHLRSLYLDALRFQIDPMDYFRDVAAISSTETPFNITGEEADWDDLFPMRAFLTRFEESAFFQSGVRPLLPNP